MSIPVVHPTETSGVDIEQTRNEGRDLLSPGGNDHVGGVPSSQSTASPFSRAGLLKTASVSQSHNVHGARPNVFSHTQSEIRNSTLQLSNLMLAPSGVSKQDLPTRRRASAPSHPFRRGSFMLPNPSTSLGYALEDEPEECESEIFPISAIPTPSTEEGLQFSTERSLRADLTQFENISSSSSGGSTPRAATVSSVSPSGLSILLARRRQDRLAQDGESQTSRLVSPHGGPMSPVPESSMSPKPTLERNEPSFPSALLSSRTPIETYRRQSTGEASESAPLLSEFQHPLYMASQPSFPSSPKKAKFARAIARLRKSTSSESLSHLSIVALSSLPAVFLGSLLNILDGVSYGMIMFPSNEIFTNFGGIGVSMFFVTTIISQLVYSFGGSSFAGANGSMMIEVVPFFHILASRITNEIGENHPAEIISTTIVGFALSAILTGLTFFLLGFLRLGVLIGFFPRHILVGCIGGVGIFLLQTGLAVCARIDDDDFTYDLDTLTFFTTNGGVLARWLPAFGLAVLLRLITHKFHHQLIFPIYFIAIPAIFYIIVAALGVNISVLRSDGWVFDMGASSRPWYTFYSYFDFKLVSFRALWKTLPTQFALLFFNVLHPPLNVPALAVSLAEDVDTNKELVAHGYSNLLAGFFGTVPNYLVYVNTLLFYRVGGVTRISGFLLAMFTVVLLVVGTAPIGFIRMVFSHFRRPPTYHLLQAIMVVGALIFVLGIDLVKEALYDTRNRVSKMEYITIICIMVCMTLWDFVIGVLFGIIVCCFFFVIQNSQYNSIRALHSAESAMSAVRRPSAHREYIRAVAKQTMILKLQGFLFFGTITRVEEAIRELVDLAHWQQNPIRFLIIDFTAVAGVDMSSAEAFVRVQRLLSSRSVTMVLCGFSAKSTVERSLQNVGVLDADYVEVFSSFHEALEWTENAYLRAWFMSHKAENDNYQSLIALPGRQKSGFALGESFANSPRKLQVQDAAGRTIAQVADDFQMSNDDNEPDLFFTLKKVFSAYGDLDRDTFRPLVAYLSRVSVPQGVVLWHQGDPADSLYLIESGVLRATYKFREDTDTIEESMVGGAVSGELSALTGLPRNATVTVERQSVLWKLSSEDLARLEVDHPALARAFINLVLKAAKIDYDILLAALAARQ